MKKSIGTILLDRNDNYVYENGKLPDRVDDDKEWLKYFLDKEVISFHAASLLPPSMLQNRLVGMRNTVPVTIKELAEADILIVIRNDVYNRAGKKFRLNAFKKLFNTREVEIWIRK